MQLWIIWLNKADLSATRSDTAYIRGRLKNLPTAWHRVGTILAGTIGLAGALRAAVQLRGHA